MTQSFLDLKDEILNTYRVLDANLADVKNKDTIAVWFMNGVIDDQTYSRLTKFNRDTYYDIVNGRIIWTLRYRSILRRSNERFNQLEHIY